MFTDVNFPALAKVGTSSCHFDVVVTLPVIDVEKPKPKRPGEAG